MLVDEDLNSAALSSTYLGGERVVQNRVYCAEMVIIMKYWLPRNFYGILWDINILTREEKSQLLTFYLDG